MTDIFTRIKNAEPVDTVYRFGLGHHNRIHARGYVTEARVWAKTLISQTSRRDAKFLILTRARSGSTLLRSLLDDHSDITCDGEVLNYAVAAPAAHIDRLAHKARTPVYGAKVLSYQLAQIQNMPDPRPLLDRLATLGFRFIHLRRSTCDQALSLSTAQASGRFHARKTGDATYDAVRLDPETFCRRLRYSDLLAEMEVAALAAHDPLEISYEHDLSDPGSHQAMANRLFDALGVARQPVKSTLKKILPKDPAQLIENFDEVAAAVAERNDAGYFMNRITI